MELGRWLVACNKLNFFWRNLIFLLKVKVIWLVGVLLYMWLTRSPHQCTLVQYISLSDVVVFHHVGCEAQSLVLSPAEWCPLGQPGHQFWREHLSYLRLLQLTMLCNSSTYNIKLHAITHSTYFNWLIKLHPLWIYRVRPYNWWIKNACIILILSRWKFNNS